MTLIKCNTVQELIRSIKNMQIRGAPAIGVAGAMGVAMAAARAAKVARTKIDLLNEIKKDAEALERARPTAVNLAWGVARAMEYLNRLPSDTNPEEAVKKVIEFVKQLADADVSINRELSKIGQRLIRNNARILTHCN
jgi:methylthioribose-1-phosphate isomerase